MLSPGALYFDVHVVVGGVVGGGVYVVVTVGAVVGLTISLTAVTCWVCPSSPVLQSNIRVQQKLGLYSQIYIQILYSNFTLSNTAVTCNQIFHWI